MLKPRLKPSKRRKLARYHQPVKLGNRTYCPVCNTDMWVDQPEHQLCEAVVTDFAQARQQTASRLLALSR